MSSKESLEILNIDILRSIAKISGIAKYAKLEKKELISKILEVTFIVGNKKEIIKNTKYSYLIGPISLYEYRSNKYNKRVYLFGDYHSKDAMCKKSYPSRNPYNTINIDKFIEYTLLQNPNKIIDVFLEATYTKGTIKEMLLEVYKTSYLADTIDTFKNPEGTSRQADSKDCLHDKKESECKYHNGRFHYTDVRNFTPDLFIINAILDDSSDNKGKLELLKNLLSLFSDKDDSTFILTDILKNTKIMKQLKNIKDESVKTVLINYVSNIISKNIITVKEMKRLLSILQKGEEMEIIDKIFYYYLQNKWNKITSVLMDVYLLSRMFRSFSQKDSTSIHLIGEKDDEINNIIIYAGDCHIRLYCEIFEKLDFDFIEESSSMKFDEDLNPIKEEHDFQCLNIRKFKQPFFS